MSEDQLKRLEEGIRRAHEAGNADHVKLLGAEYRRIQQSLGSQEAPATGVFSNLSNAFKANVDPILEGTGSTAKVLGAEKTGEFLKGLTSLPENYESGGERFMNADEDGSYAWRYLPEAIGEQVGQFGGSIAARAIGAAGGASLGSLAGPGGTIVGGVAGGIAGPAAFEAMQVLGPIAEERAKNDGRTEINSDDLKAAAVTAAGMGLLNGLAPGAQGFIKRMFIEGGTEALQSGVQQAGETALTEKGLEVDPRQAVGEGIIGFGSAGAVDTAIKGAEVTVDGVNKVTGDALSRTDNREFSDPEVLAAQRLKRAADNSDEILANVRDTGEGTAKGAANAALGEAKAEANVVINRLRSLVKAQKDDTALSALNTIAGGIGKQVQPIPDSQISSMISALGNSPDAQRLASLAREINVIEEFTRGGTRDMGGFTQITRRLDWTDKRNTFGVMALAAAAGGGFATGSPAVLAAGPAINRAFRVVDNMTNRRSRVKRFVDSALKDARQPLPIPGPDARQQLQELKDLAREQRTPPDLLNRAGGKFANPNDPLAAGKPPAPGEGPLSKAQKAEAEAAARAEAEAARFRLNAVSTEEIFETDTIPPGNPYYEPYEKWAQFTGAGPATTLEVLEQLAREGAVPANTPQRFREDIHSFKTDYEYAPIQNLVRQRINPNHKPADAIAAANQAPKAPRDPNEIVEKLRLRQATAKDGYEFKKLQGQTAAVQLDADIDDAAASLTPDQHQMLIDLKESINSAGVTRAERFKLVNDIIPLIFPKRNQKPLVDIWIKKFNKLAGAGNDKAIFKPEDQTDPVEVQKEEEFKAKKQKAIKRKKDPKTPAEPQPETSAKSPVDPGERALEKLKEKQGKPKVEEPVAEIHKVNDAKEPQIDPKVIAAAPKPKGNRAGGMAKMLDERIAQKYNADFLAAEFQEEFNDHVAKLPRSTYGRVVGLIYDFANDRLTVNQLAEGFSTKFDVPIIEATNIVNNQLAQMEQEGKLKRFRPFGSNRLRHDGKYAKDEKGKGLDVLQIEFIDPELVEWVEVAKAIRQVEKTVDVKADPDFEFNPNATVIGPFEAIKDVPPSRIDGTFTPILDFINKLRNSRLKINDKMLTQIEEAFETSDTHKKTLTETMLPKKNGVKDEGPMRTVAQILFQHGKKEERTDTLFRQEWKAGANLRVYSMNGMAHTQSGDIMKGLVRAPEKYPLGGEKGLKYIFHGIGNLLGFDKKSPLERRQALFLPGVADRLVEFANDPYGRTRLQKSNGETTQVGEIVNDGEGFFQVLNAAHEVKNMVDWVRERHPARAKMDTADLLAHPAVQKDLAENYETDFIVQLDASNNAYQIAGMVMGYEDVLRATGILPPVGMEGDPDATQGADIYMEPAKSIAQRLNEFLELNLPDSKLRKIFKKPIGTYLYAAEFNSRKEAFRSELEAIAGEAPIVGINGDGLIEMPKEMLDGLMSEQGFTFMDTHFDINGDIKSEKPITKRIVEGPKGGKVGGKFDPNKPNFVIATSEGGKFKKAKKKYDTAEDAAKALYEGDLYVRMNRELVRDMNTRYPGMRQYLKFAETISNIVKAKGRESVAVPTKDGMTLEYNFKQAPAFTGVQTQITDAKGVVRNINLGVRTTDYKLAGRGLAAFMTHQLDAWALRETFRRLPDLKAFNPIHDSFGFHPSDAARGQETWVQVMQEIGSDDFNLFLNIMQANGISLEEYVAAGGDPSFVLGRKGVAPVPASQIPTALS